jgi:hypothetical protein
MSLVFLEPCVAIELINLASSGTPLPKEILEYKKRLEAAQKAAELAYVAHGGVHPVIIAAIVEMKIELDSMYGAWAQASLN